MSVVIKKCNRCFLDYNFYQQKEKDLELAAKIGQQLLQRNKALEERNGILETEVTNSNDKITQLKHDLQMKTDLLQIYTNDVEDSSCDSKSAILFLFFQMFLQIYSN